MKLCYVDETGMDDGSEVVLTVGIVIDATTRLVKATRESRERLKALTGLVSDTMPELKSSQLYHGAGKWGRLSGEQRHAEISSLVEWFCDGNYKIALAAADKDKGVPDGLDGIRSLESLTAYHVILQVQRAHQGAKKNKGTTLLVMDQSKLQGQTVELILDPPAWADQYYQRGRRDEPFNQIVHAPFYVESHQFPLVQLADLVAFVYRQHVNVQRHGEAYAGERDRVGGWVGQLDGCLLPSTAIHPKQKAGPGPALIHSVRPAELS